MQEARSEMRASCRVLRLLRRQQPPLQQPQHLLSRLRSERPPIRRNYTRRRQSMKSKFVVNNIVGIIDRVSHALGKWQEPIDYYPQSQSFWAINVQHGHKLFRKQHEKRRRPAATFVKSFAYCPVVYGGFYGPCKKSQEMPLWTIDQFVGSDSNDLMTFPSLPLPFALSTFVQDAAERCLRYIDPTATVPPPRQERWRGF